LQQCLQLSLMQLVLVPFAEVQSVNRKNSWAEAAALPQGQRPNLTDAVVHNGSDLGSRRLQA